MSEFGKMTMGDVSFRGKRVLIRVDFNGATDGGALKSTKRIDASLPTIQRALDAGASQVILMSHNGRFKDIAKDPAALSLAPVVPHLSEKLGMPVAFEASFRRPVIRDARVVMMENTRADERDEKGDMSLAAEIISAVDPDIYVLDGFSVAHRDQASVTLPAVLMKQAGRPAVAGDLMYREYDFFVNRVILDPARPFLVFLGGAKVGTKMPTLRALLPSVDRIVLGGAMVYPFMLERGMKVHGLDPFAGKGGRERELEEERANAKRVLEGEHASKIVIPTLVVGPDRRVINVAVDVVPQAFSMKDVLITDLLPELAAAGY